MAPNLFNLSAMSAAYSRLTVGVVMIRAVGRIFNVVGPGLDERHLCAHLARQFVELSACDKSISVGLLNSTRDFIDVRDVAEALVLLLRIHESASEGTFNLASGDEQRTQRVYDFFSESVGVKPETDNRQQTRKLDIDRSYANVSRIRALGFEARFTLQESLVSLLNYYRHNKFAG